MTTTVTPPPLLLQATMSSPSIVSTYTDISNPYHGKPSTWSVHLNVIPKSTGYSGSNTPYAYNALDVSVGDWIAGSGLGGRANQIISIVGSVTATSLTAIVNDPGCYNATLDITKNGNGLGSPGTVYIFKVGENGLPIITPEFTNIFDPIFGTDLLSRFFNNLQLGNSLTIESNDTIETGVSTLNFGSGNSVSISGSIANITSRPYATMQAQWFQGAVVQNGTFYFTFSAPYSGTIKSLDWFTFNGTSFSLEIDINGVAVGGLSGLSIDTSTPNNTITSGINTFTAGAAITGVITNVSGSPTQTLLSLNIIWDS
jgi:hypothetical protein